MLISDIICGRGLITIRRWVLQSPGISHHEVKVRITVYRRTDSSIVAHKLITRDLVCVCVCVCVCEREREREREQRES